MAPLFFDVRFPEFRKDRYYAHRASRGTTSTPRGASPVYTKAQFNTAGLTGHDTVVPGIMNMGRILDVGTFTGLPTPDRDNFGWGNTPASGADIIVTVLYQHSPNTLRRFLDCPEGVAFWYTHTHITIPEADGVGTSMPFMIIREGAKVKAGFPDGYVDGEINQEWQEYVSYNIGKSGEWAQLCTKKRASENQHKPMAGAFLNDTSGNVEQREWESDVAVEILQSALTSRRWVRQPGFQIAVTETPIRDESISDQFGGLERLKNSGKDNTGSIKADFGEGGSREGGSGED